MIVNQRLLKYVKGIPLKDNDKRTISVTFAFPTIEITVFGVYAPPGHDKEFFLEELARESWY